MQSLKVDGERCRYLYLLGRYPSVKLGSRCLVNDFLHVIVILISGEETASNSDLNRSKGEWMKCVMVLLILEGN